MSISKSEFQEWKTSDVTKAFYVACKNRMDDAKDILASSAGLDSDSDNFYRGFIAAYNEIPEFRVEDTHED